MQTNNRFFDDIARVASGAAGALGGVKGELESLVKDRLERLLSEMDLVSREEFDVVKAMAVKARTEQEILVNKIHELEAKLATAYKPTAKPHTTKKSPTKSKSK